MLQKADLDEGHRNEGVDFLAADVTLAVQRPRLAEDVDLLFEECPDELLSMYDDLADQLALSLLARVMQDLTLQRSNQRTRLYRPMQDIGTTLDVFPA